MGTQIQKLFIEEDYSKFYKAQLYLAIQDDYAAFSGGVHRYEDHVAKLVSLANKSGLISGFQNNWLESDDGESHPFRGANLRNFFRGKNSAYAIWAVFDLYLKYTNPKIASGFSLEGYLERAGIVLHEFINRSYDTPKDRELIAGLYGTTDNSDERLYLSIELLADRQFSLAHTVVERTTDLPHQEKIEGFEDKRTRINKGVFVEQPQGNILLIRDIERGTVSVGFASAQGDDIRFHQVGLDGEQQTHILSPTENERASHLIKTANYKEDV